jgi:hypothetical protein
MNIITSTLDQVSGLDILASGSLVVFFILFLWIVYRIIRTSKRDADKWGNIPFDSDFKGSDLNMNEKNI